jgi:S-adenosylmethionine uptake transporter
MAFVVIHTVALFRYSGLLFGLLIGYIVWDEIPNPMAWLGIFLLFGSGLMIFEKRISKHLKFNSKSHTLRLN